MPHFQTLKTYEDFFDQMSPAQEKTDEVCAWYTGLAHPLFNSVFHIRTDKDLDKRVDMLIGKAGIAPLSFWVHPQNKAPGLTKILIERGFQPVAVCSLMTWTPKAFLSLEISITNADKTTFHDVLGKAFHFDETLKHAYLKLLDNAIGVENYLIYVDGEAVCTGSLIPLGHVGGIFNISTLPDFRKRGLAKAMTMFLVNRAHELGLKNGVLLSSAEAFPLYERLGFEKCFDVEMYAK